MTARPPLKIFIAGLAHETNSFSPLPTSLRSLEADVCYRPPDTLGRDAALASPGYGDALAAACQGGSVVVEGPCFWTQPSGPMSRALYVRLRDEVLAALRAAGHVDAVVLNLHGAMMAQDVPDCEGDLLTQVRAALGPSTPIGVLLDLHGNVSPEMVQSGAVLIGVKEYPHIDYRERAEELLALVSDMARGGARPLTTLRTIPLLSLQGTTEDPMRGLVQRLRTLETQAGIRSVTLMHGFPWSDSALTGASVIVLSEGVPAEQAASLADDLAERFVGVVEASPVTRLDVGQAVDEALATRRGSGPVIIADSSDNPGGGAACDSTFLLREILDRGIEDAAVGMIWDPQSALVAADAGVGARIPLRIGGKVGPQSGAPIDLEVEVMEVRADVRQRIFSEDPAGPLGLAVRLRAGGVQIVVNSIRQQVFSPECFTALGVDLTRLAVVVVKSSQHFRGRFEPLARRIIYCNAPGSLSTDLLRLPYLHLRLTQRGGGVFTDQPIIRMQVQA